MDDKQRVKIVTRTKALKRVSNIVSNKYSFPYRKNCYYQNTWGADREGGKRKHEGTDLFTKEGTPIYAISSGKLEKLGWNRLGGERVGIRGEDGIYFYYAHLSKINPKLVVGSYIEKETLIGYTGHTGDAVGTPDHLHFGMEVETGVWINPYYFLKYWQMESDGK